MCELLAIVPARSVQDSAVLTLTLKNNGGDEGAISSVIQSWNPSRVPEYKIWNIRSERNAEFPRRVPSRCCVFLRTCGNKSMLQ